MRKVIFKEPPVETEAYAYDVDIIVSAFAAFDKEIDRESARKAWQAYSETMCAGWLIMEDSTNTRIYYACLPFVETVDDETA